MAATWTVGTVWEEWEEWEEWVVWEEWRLRVLALVDGKEDAT